MPTVSPGAHVGSRIYQQPLVFTRDLPAPTLPDQTAPVVGRMADLISLDLFVSTYESPSLENIHSKNKQSQNPPHIS